MILDIAKDDTSKITIKGFYIMLKNILQNLDANKVKYLRYYKSNFWILNEGVKI